MRAPLSGLIAFFLMSSVAVAEAPKGVGGSVNGAVVWVPDYYGQYVLIDTFDANGNLSTRKISVAQITPSTASRSPSAPPPALRATSPMLPPSRFALRRTSRTGEETLARGGGNADKSCSPNALTVEAGSLYVVCNSDFGGIDQILVYDANSLAYVKTITGTDVNGADYFTGSSLTGILFDAKGNLWTSGYANNTLLRVPKANLAEADPHIDREVIDSPDSPAGLALDSDKSVWVVGQYQGGIVVNFTNAVLNQPGSFLKNNPLSPTPRYCISNSISGCQPMSGLFDNPEGVAVFHHAVWVSNNGGNAPAATIVRLAVSGGALDASTYGGTVNAPFACPGGMFAATGPTGIETLWVNDEGRNVVNTDCGSTSGDQSATAGLVMEFLNGGLKASHQAAPVNFKFSNWKKVTTSSPGFGGIFVQLK